MFLLPAFHIQPGAESCVFSSKEGHLHPSSPLLYSILLCYWLCFLPSSQICPIPQSLSLHSLIRAVPAHSASWVWSDHNMLLLPRSLIVTVCCLLNSSLHHCQSSHSGPLPYSPLLRYFLPQGIPLPEHQPYSSNFLTHMPFWSQPGPLMMTGAFLQTTSWKHPPSPLYSVYTLTSNLSCSRKSQLLSAIFYASLESCYCFRISSCHLLVESPTSEELGRPCLVMLADTLASSTIKVFTLHHPYPSTQHLRPIQHLLNRHFGHMVKERNLKNFLGLGEIKSFRSSEALLDSKGRVKIWRAQLGREVQPSPSFPTVSPRPTRGSTHVGMFWLSTPWVREGRCRGIQ